jgi:hypothetical protein
LFTEDEMRMILPDCKIVSKNAGEIIFQYDLADKINHFTYVIEGDVMVTRTIDDEEVSQGKSVENSFFGAYKHLRKALLSYSLVREEEEEEVPILQGGNGVKNTIIKAATPVTLMRMRSTHFSKLKDVISKLLYSTCNLRIPLVTSNFLCILCKLHGNVGSQKRSSAPGMTKLFSLNAQGTIAKSVV